jgi:hypothetical protein
MVGFEVFGTHRGSNPDQKRFLTENLPNVEKLPRTAMSPKARAVNATASAFLHDQDPNRTSGAVTV